MLDNPWYKCPEPQFLWCCGLVTINVSYLIIEVTTETKTDLIPDRPYADGMISIPKPVKT